MAVKAKQQYYADETTIKKEAREFGMIDELKDKLDSIEYGAQVNIIEEVQENGVPLEIVDKSVNVLVPEVIDNLYTIDPNNSLSAKQGKILYDMIKNLLARGRFLSTWNTATGLPVTNPEESPYEYKAGDYYIVGIVAAEGGTNFRPEPGEYVINVASDEQETSEVHVSDIYVYDGENWILLINSTRELAVDDYVDYTYQSTNPVENQAIAKEFVKKQNKFYTVSTTQPSNPVEGDEWYDATNDKVFYWDGTQWKEMGGGSTYTAGLHISIDPNDNNKISVVEWAATSSALGLVKLGSDTEQTATPNNVSSTAGRTYRIQTNSSGQLLVNIPWTDNDTTYTAGTGINISNQNVISSTVRPVTVGPTAPANAQTGDLWYDTTKNTMFLYKNNAWTIIGPEIFPITKANYDALSQAEQNDGRFFLITDNDGTIYVDWENVQGRPMYIGTTAPSNPNEGYLWYDTTNDVLKVYDGTQWNEIGGGTTYAAGNGINISNNEISVDTTVVATKTDLNSKQDVFHTTSSTAPSNPSEGDEWYDSTNDVLKVYDGTNWIVTGKTYTAGDGIDIDANNEISVDVTDIIGTGLSEDSSNNIIVDTSAIQEKLTASDGIDIDGSNNISVDVTDIIGTGLSEDASNNITIDTTVVATQTDLTSKQDKATSGSGAPATTPTYVGQVYIDTTNDNMYVATGTSSSSDWTAVDTNTTYTAGDGIDITNDEISVDTSDLAGTGLSTDANNNLVVDTTVIQEKLTAGDGIDIDANNEISVDVTDVIGTGLSEDANNNLTVDSTVVALKSDLTNYYTKTETYTKTEVDNLISSFGNFEVVASLPSVSTASEKTIYLLGPIGTGADKYEEWIVTNETGHFESASTITHESIEDTFDGTHFHIWNEGYTVTNKYIGITNFQITNGCAYVTDYGGSCECCELTNNTQMPFIGNGAFCDSTEGYEHPDILWCDESSGDVSFDLYYSDSPLTWNAGGKVWTKIGETSVDLSGYATTTALTNGLATKQDTLTAGDGIDIDANDEISVDVTDIIGTGLSEDANNNIIVDTTVVATQTDLSGKQDKATSGSTAPSTTPSYVGQQYIDTTNDKMYVATGTTSSSDWTEVGAGSGDMLYSDFNWVTKTGATITLDLRSEITPSANFTVNAPATIKDGQFYVLRVDNGATAYTMTLGTGVTNPYSEDLTLVANNIQQFMFLAKGGNLELQPSTEIDISGKQDKATSGSTAPSTTPSYIGQQYVDTTNDKLYVATGTTSSSDWSEVGSGSGDMAYADFNWVSKTGAAVILDLNSTITPSANFTVNAPATIKDGQVYILRVINGATAYTMTLGTGITNPYSTSTTLTVNGVDQFVFQAIGGSLELLPDSDVDLSGKQDKATSGSAAPSTTPTYVGQQYIDTTNDKMYFASGTSSSSDWTEVGAGGGFTVVSTLPAIATADDNLEYFVGPTGTGADKYEEYVVTYPTIEDKVTISSSSTSATISDTITITASDISITRASGFIIAYSINVYQNGNVLFGYSYGGVPSGLLDANGDPVDSITIPAGTISASDFSTITSISIKVGEHIEKTWTKVGETSPDLSTYALASDVNTKTFTLSNLQDTTTIGNAAAWKNAGKNPIIAYNGYYYETGSYSSGNSWTLYATKIDINSDSASQKKLVVSYDMGSPVGLSIISEGIGGLSALIDVNTLPSVSTADTSKIYVLKNGTNYEPYIARGDSIDGTYAINGTFTITESVTLTKAMFSGAANGMSGLFNGSSPVCAITFNSNGFCNTLMDVSSSTQVDSITLNPGTYTIKSGALTITGAPQTNLQWHILGGSGGITNNTTGTTSSITQMWIGTEAEYQALSSYSADILYFTTDS